MFWSAEQFYDHIIQKLVKKVKTQRNQQTIRYQVLAWLKKIWNCLFIHLAVAYFRRTKTTSCNSYFLCIRYMDRYCKESFWTFLLDWCLGMIIFQKQTEKKISETNNYLFFNTCPVKYIPHGPSKLWCTQWGHNLSEVAFVVQFFERDFNSFRPLQ